MATLEKALTSAFESSSPEHFSGQTSGHPWVDNIITSDQPDHSDVSAQINSTLIPGTIEAHKPVAITTSDESGNAKQPVVTDESTEATDATKATDETEATDDGSFDEAVNTPESIVADEPTEATGGTADIAGSITKNIAANETVDTPENVVNNLLALSEKAEQLAQICARLTVENKSLREQKDVLQTERDALYEKSEQLRTRIDTMVVRLKSLEQS